MKIVFLSNFFNHHQKPFSDELYLLNPDYFFIETMDEFPAEQKAMGYEVKETPKYVLNYCKQKELCAQLIDEADVVICGSAPEFLINARKKKNKVIVRYSERPLKKKPNFITYLKYLVGMHIRTPFRKPIYMLCASAYAASDFRLFGMYMKKTYKWGYFTEVKKFEDIDALIQSKQKKSILWASRLLSWKHPEMAVYLAEYLNDKGLDFKMRIIGSGEQEEMLKSLIQNKKLDGKVFLLGRLTQTQVRQYMEKSEIFITTSDRQEGWGATVNESMNSACAVVADKRIGSVPFLVQDGVNGFAYNGEQEFYTRVDQLLSDDVTRVKLAKNAYKTMLDVWNPKLAARRFLKLSECLIKTGQCDCFENGPCSRAV